jgi:hypothetical protein
MNIIEREEYLDSRRLAVITHMCLCCRKLQSLDSGFAIRRAIDYVEKGYEISGNGNTVCREIIFYLIYVERS